MKRSSSASSPSASASSDSTDSDSDSAGAAADNKKKREEEQEEEDLWQHLTYWIVEPEDSDDSDDSELMDQDNGDDERRVFAKIYAVDAENGATTEQLIELFDPFFTTDDGGVTDSELMMVCLDLVSGSL